jgi:hypothetical protein
MLVPFMILLKLSSSSKPNLNYTQLQLNFKTISTENKYKFNITYHNESDLFWVSLKPSILKSPYKKVLILGGLYGSEFESEVILNLLNEIIASTTAEGKNIKNYLQLDFFPVPNYKLYKYLETLSERPKDPIFSDLSLVKTCNDKISGIDPDMNFKAEWKESEKEICGPGFPGDKPMDSYVTKEINYSSYDVIYNIQYQSKDFVCGPFSTKDEKIEDISVLYEKAYEKIFGEYKRDNCYKAFGKKRFGTLIDYAASKDIFALQLSKGKLEINLFNYFVNVTSELFTGPHITMDYLAKENLVSGSPYSKIEWSFYITNYDSKKTKATIDLSLTSFFKNYNLTKVVRQEYNLKMEKLDNKKTFNDVEIGSLKIEFNDTLHALRIFKYTVYIEKIDDIEEYQFEVDVKVFVEGNEEFAKEVINSVNIILDEKNDEFGYTNIVIGLMVVVFCVSILGILLCVMRENPYDCSKGKESK